MIKDRLFGNGTDFPFMMPHGTKTTMVYIGIDPGETNGVAIYSREIGLKLYQTSFWDLVDFITQQVGPAMRSNLYAFDIVIEAPQLNSFMYGKRTAGKEMAVQLTIARNVGMNQNDAKRIAQYLRRIGIEPREVAPTNKSQKWSADYFEKLSGITTLKTHEHMRDAARMIAHAWAGKLKTKA
jgi:hypothetical protein